MCQSCVEHFANMSHKVINAVINHRDEFMALMNKIRQDIGEELMKAEVALAKTDATLAVEHTYPELEDLDQPGDEEDGNIEDDENYKAVSSLLVANYLTSFLAQQLQDAHEFDGLMVALHKEGTMDGHAYARVKELMKH